MPLSHAVDVSHPFTHAIKLQFLIKSIQYGAANGKCIVYSSESFQLIHLWQRNPQTPPFAEFSLMTGALGDADPKQSVVINILDNYVNYL